MHTPTYAFNSRLKCLFYVLKLKYYFILAISFYFMIIMYCCARAPPRAARVRVTLRTSWRGNAP